MAKNFLLGIFILHAVVHASGFTPDDNYLIDCGSPANTTVDGRVFVGDNPASLFSVSSGDTIFGSTNSSPVGSVNGLALYATARIFTTQSSYTFPIKTQGRHWVRLYFFPFIYRTYDLKAAQFDVRTHETVLLSNFQAQNACSAVFKEFSVVVNSGSLVLSFVPSSSSFAFINAIEVVSVPSNLISDSAPALSSKTTHNGLASTALETMFRVNMGGPLVTPLNDSLQRTWVDDQEFLLHKGTAMSVTTSQSLTYRTGGATPYTAPSIVYATAEMMNPSNTAVSRLFNITWQFSLDFSYSYLVRLHFCDLISRAQNELVFNAYIGDFAAATNLDIYSTLQSLATPYYMDFVVPATLGAGTLTVSVGPSTLPAISPNATLNGLEIMKFGLAPTNPSSKNAQKIAILVGAVVGSLVLIILCVVAICMLRRHREGKEPQSWIAFCVDGGHRSRRRVSSTTLNTTVSSLQNGTLGFRFPLIELQEATNNFDEGCVIGVGGFGKVFKGRLRDGTEVAVKRANGGSQQGMKEFLTEIDTLSKFRHRHLVWLIGFCDEQLEMILVYEYMANGTLRSHLYGSDLPNLIWKQRLEICIGAARGLHYLHTGSAQGIIHRDVKSANILLDENLLSKVSDFGLSKMGPDLDQTHVSTAVKGSFGYLDPEYFRRQQLTQKSDIYSFGVVLLEVLCARPVIDPTLPRDKVNIVEWVMKSHKKGELQQVIDPRLAGTINPASLRKFWETIERCLAEYGVDRPTISDVLWNLECALQLQETQTPLVDPNGNSTNHIIDFPVEISQNQPHESQMVNRNGTPSDLSVGNVFSQLFNTEGR